VFGRRCRTRGGPAPGVSRSGSTGRCQGRRRSSVRRQASRSWVAGDHEPGPPVGGLGVRSFGAVRSRPAGTDSRTSSSSTAVIHPCRRNGTTGSANTSTAAAPHVPCASSPTRPPQYSITSTSLLPLLDELADRWLDEHRVLDGSPLLIDPDGQYDGALNQCFMSSWLRNSPRNTQAAVAYDLKKWLDFLGSSPGRSGRLDLAQRRASGPGGVRAVAKEGFEWTTRRGFDVGP
jgi:hypothetical protein